MLPTGRVLTPAKFSSDIEALIEMTALVRSLGVFLGDGEAILSRAACAHPDAFGACRLALAYADRNGSQTRSRLDFLSLARAVMLDDLIGAASLDLILHPVADTVSLVRTLADITPEQAAFAARSSMWRSKATETAACSPQTTGFCLCAAAWSISPKASWRSCEKSDHAVLPLRFVKQGTGQGVCASLRNHDAGILGACLPDHRVQRRSIARMQPHTAM